MGRRGGEAEEAAAERSSGGADADACFESMNPMLEKIHQRDFAAAAPLVRAHLEHLPGLVRDRDSGPFCIASIPGLEQGGTALALVGDDAGLARMREIAASLPERAPWVEGVEQHAENRRLFDAIVAVVEAHPNRRQPETLVRAPEGNGVAERFVRTLKEQLRWVNDFDTIEDLNRALQEWLPPYNEHWLVQRHGHRSPAKVRRDLRALEAVA